MGNVTFKGETYGSEDLARIRRNIKEMGELLEEMEKSAANLKKYIDLLEKINAAYMANK